MRCLPLVLVLSLLLVEKRVFSQTSNEYPSITVCFNDISSFQDPKVSINLNGLEFLQSQLMFKNCTHLVGSLIVAHLGPNADGSDPDLSFLNGIKDISGFLYIYNVTVKELNFPSLEIIRGKSHLSTLEPTNKSGSLIISNNTRFKENFFLKKISMPNLKSVLSSNVIIWNNYHLCHVYTKIDWNNIIESTEEFSFIRDSPVFDCSTETCSSDCNKPFCFGEKENECQIKNKCEVRNCTTGVRRCYMYKNSEECCPQQCAAGCFERRCDACLNVLLADLCVPSCPPRMIMGHGRLVNNPKFAFTFGPICVKTCPPSSLIDTESCVLECSKDFMEPINGTCTECLGSCAKKCNMADIKAKLGIDASQQAVDANMIRELKGCVHLKGDLIINQLTFQDNPRRRIKAVKSASEFYDSLSSLRTISGRLSIKDVKGPVVLKDLSFLENLEEIGGNVAWNSDEATPFAVENSDITFLGFKKLTKIGNIWQSIKLNNLPNLCYQPSPIYLNDITASEDPVQETGVKSRSDCENDGKMCDPMCSDLGCWGPGPQMCVKCKFVMAGGTCAEQCSDVPGYYTDPTSGMCLPCNRLCLQGCTGPQPTQCVGGCKSAKDGDECVEKCPTNKYLDTLNNECLNCSEHCHINKEEESCKGPSAVPGPNGCNKCDGVIVDRSDNVIQCFSPKTCPNGMYISYVDKNGKIEQVFPPGLTHYSACKKCHDFCPSCSGETTKRQHCQMCSKVWNDDKCVATCPEDAFVGNESKCEPCDLACRGCIGRGNSSCSACKHLKVYVHGYYSSNREFYCNLKECPPDKPESVPESNVHVCVDKITYSKIRARHQLLVGGTVVGACVILVILVALALSFCRWKIRVEKQRLLEDLKNKFSNYESADKRSSSPSQMQLALDDDRLIVVNPADMSYLPDKRSLPKGRFGKVYQGKWHVPLPLCEKYGKEKSRVKLPVAIREVKQEQFLSYDSPTRVEANVKEIKTLAGVDERHCLRLLGCYFDDHKCYLITVFREKGPLDKYLRDNKSQIYAHTLLAWAEQIALGMTYLDEVKIVHQNLAARNVLVVDETLLQITDYGLAKLMRLNPLSGPHTPMRWMAIETLRDGHYSVYSDIWAYGVTLWEMFTLGQLPYDDVDVVDIKEHVEKGGRLQQPKSCSLDVFLLMVKCWMEDPELRISFKELATRFHDFSLRPTTYLSIAGDPAQQTNATNHEHGISMEEFDPLLHAATNESIETRQRISYPYPDPSPHGDAFSSFYGDGRMSSQQPLLPHHSMNGDYLVPKLAGSSNYPYHQSLDSDQAPGKGQFPPSGTMLSDQRSTAGGDGFDDGEYLIANPLSGTSMDNYGNNQPLRSDDEYLPPSSANDVTLFLEPSFPDSPLYLHPHV